MSSEQDSHNKTALSPVKRNIFTLLTIAVPIIVLVCLELTLRWLNYGHDVSLFIEHTIGGRTLLRENPDVKYRYFGVSRFSPSTSPTYFRMPKPSGVFRIFCLGGSTTVGYPYYYNGSFSTYLLDRLRAIFPDKNIEVINMGMTATNSYTALDIGEELQKYQPDLIIDYDGHNEFYGALGAGSNESVGSARFMTLLYLRLIHFRTFQLLRDAIDGAMNLTGHKTDSLSRGTEMERLSKGEYIAASSRVYEKTLSIFRANLNALKDYCRANKVPLILGTQASNLRDQPPFISDSVTGLNEEQKSEMENEMKAGAQFEEEGFTDSAAVQFGDAVAAAPEYAMAHFRLAQCLDSMGEKVDALREYILARDFDELRFRTDTRFNDDIRSMNDNSDCLVADIERYLMAASPDSMLGHNLITEHLHPNSRGYFLMAKCYALTMRNHGLLASREEWSQRDTVSDSSLWVDRSVTELDERIAVQSTDILTSGWPFKNEAPVRDTVQPSDTLGVIAQDVVNGNLDWGNSHLRAIVFYQRRGDWKAVEREYRAILSQDPPDVPLYLYLARLYLQGNHTDKMISLLRRSLNINPSLQVYRTLGDALMQEGKVDEALTYYTMMDDFPQTPSEQVQNGLAISYAYAKDGDYFKAKSKLIEILEMKPDLQPARQLLDYVDAKLSPGTRH